MIHEILTWYFSFYGVCCESSILIMFHSYLFYAILKHDAETHCKHCQYDASVQFWPNHHTNPIYIHMWLTTALLITHPFHSAQWGSLVLLTADNDSSHHLPPGTCLDIKMPSCQWTKSYCMMKSSNGNNFHITGLLYREFTSHKGQWREALMFSLICAWINSWVNNQEAGELRCHCAHYDVTVMWLSYLHNKISYTRKTASSYCYSALWCLRSSVPFLFVQKHLQTDNKINVEALYYWPSVRGGSTC